MPLVMTTTCVRLELAHSRCAAGARAHGAAGCCRSLPGRQSRDLARRRARNKFVYASVSSVERQITGTRWNGFQFVGLREPCRLISQTKPLVGCAIYTRKSTEEGLGQ